MNEYYKSQLLKIDENIYFIPNFKGFYAEVNGDYQRIDLNKESSAIDIKLSNKLLRKYRQKIKQAHAEKYGF